MFSLHDIKKMNSRKEACKHQRVARALNNPGGHAKDGEKGRSAKKAPTPKLFESCWWCGKKVTNPDLPCPNCAH